jgi:hypothetical protein
MRDIDMYGLRVRSAYELPEWPDATPGDPDVVIVEDPPVPASDRPLYTGKSAVNDGDLELQVHGVAHYSAIKGSHIRVAPEIGAKPEDVRLYLTGLILGVILHQRGTLALHASCVVIDGIGVAFAGFSGRGKSTLAAAFLQRGATFVSDDMCVMTQVGPQESRLWAGPPRLKLDASGLAKLDDAPGIYESAGGGRGKYHIPVSAMETGSGPIRLSRVYQLAFGEGEPRIERLNGLDAIAALMDEIYLVGWAATRGTSHEVFRKAADLCGTFTMSRLVRPRGLEHLDSVVDLIEREVK